MKSVYRIKIFLSLLIATVLSIACEEKGHDLNYVEGLASLEEEIAEPIIVVENTSFILKSDGIVPNDRLFFRSEANPNIEIATPWGYSYSGKGKDGSYTYDKSQVVVEVAFNNQWLVGKWQVVLQRGNERQVVATVDMSVLRLKKEANDENAHVNLNDLFKGIIHVYAEGWQGKGIDYYEFVNNNTKETIVLDSEVSLSDIEPYRDELVFFDRNDLATGSYSFFIRRWGYDFRQKICDFDYFLIGFANDDPITKGNDGNYSFDINLDKLVAGDVIRAGYGNEGFRMTLKEEFFNAEKQIYHIVVPSEHVKNVTFSVTLTRKRANLGLGSKQLIVS